MVKNTEIEPEGFHCADCKEKLVPIVKPQKGSDTVELRYWFCYHCDKGKAVDQNPEAPPGIYSERAILLAIMCKMYHSHIKIDESGEKGFKYVLCVHIRDMDKVLTWHIADDDLKYFRRLLVKAPQECGIPYFTTAEKYKIMEMML